MNNDNEYYDPDDIGNEERLDYKPDDVTDNGEIGDSKPEDKPEDKTEGNGTHEQGTQEAAAVEPNGSVWQPTPDARVNPPGAAMFPIGMVVATVVAALLLGAIAGAMLFPATGVTSVAVDAKNAPIVQTESFNPDEISNIEIVLLATSVLFEPATGDTIDVVWSSSEDAEVQRPSISLQEGKLSITEYEYPTDEFNAITRMFRKERTESYVTIFIPEGFSTGTLTASIVSGEFSSSESVTLDAENVSISAISGSVYAPGIRVSTLLADSITGGIFIVIKEEAPSFTEINTISGECRIVLPEGSAMNITTNSISGKVEIAQTVLDTESERLANFSTVSGDLYVS